MQAFAETDLCVPITFSYTHVIKKALFWGSNFGEILMDSHILRSPEYENHTFSGCCVCVCVQDCKGPEVRRQMRDHFPNRLCRQVRGDFSNGPSRAKRKGRSIMQRVSPGRQNKNEVFKPMEKRIIMYWAQATANVSMPMKCIFQFSLKDYKQKSNFVCCCCH